MVPATILTIEDDPAIRRGIVDALRYAGYGVREAADAEVGCELALQHGYDLLLLDLVLPGGDGLDILQQVRKGRPTLPVIVLTARGEENDRVKGLNLGADDYVVKPFSVRELLARVAAVLRRSPERPSDVSELRFGHGTVDFDRREIRFTDTTRTSLSEKEVELLRYLGSNRGRAVSREELLSHVWGITPHGVSTRTIDMHVARLREKLRDAPDEGIQVLLTVRGKGYMLAASDSPSLDGPRQGTETELPEAQS